MSDWGLVAFCYDYERVGRSGKSERVKGLVSKAYQYPGLEEMLLHAYNGLSYFQKRYDNKWINFGLDSYDATLGSWGELNAAFDVFFDLEAIRVGYDNVSQALAKQETDVDKIENTLFNCDGSDGWLFINYSGNTNDGYQLKYGYYRNELRDIRGTIDDYYKGSEKDSEENKERIEMDNEIASFFEEHATLFGSEEEFWGMETMAAEIIRDMIRKEN